MINQSQASFKTEQNLLKNELKRVQNFALLSENSSDSIIELEDVINYYGLSIFDVWLNLKELIWKKQTKTESWDLYWQVNVLLH